jgi:enoyl-CoA hydratase/carnithine racemase
MPKRAPGRTVRLEVKGAVARLVLDRPHVLNAGDAAWVADLGRAVRRLGRERGIRVVVLTGAGRAFSTGLDLDALAHGALRLPHLVAWEDAMTAMERMPAFFIAAINGHCLGGGLQMALVCDYRLASEEALIGLPAVKEGLIPSMAPFRLPRLIGLARASELILLGDNIPAREAERLGLVHRVVPAGDFPGAVEEMVERALAIPATSLRVNKALLARTFDLPFSTFRRRMQAGLRACLASPEHATAMAAIRARRRRP